ncbi:MAG: hypothetical protein QOH63_987 [Acidobacteriota bacterium]|jgi:hypothetical protein|nr:hypothetical protein [Acidobacteriota bacterium]
MKKLTCAALLFASICLCMLSTLRASTAFAQGTRRSLAPRIEVTQLGYLSALNDPVATFESARVVHNVTVDGQKGMRIHASFRVRYGLNVPCRMIAYFFDDDGTPLESGDEHYTTATGKVSASTNFTPRYDPAAYSDLQIFIPYAALNMESGDMYDLKFYLALYDKDGERFFGKSGWYKFKLTMP